ncbi:MAG: UDP-N-acetylmuramoyl-L-alanine--D-glutamate ligase [Chlorobium sp.]|nr:UDP-N-acetylmuramoyl-L-alanine--D-glutamate ligase [Chlorobium phaeovibrioides]NQU46156.1 UDP-N-acetylmuramoyl-L-alanine--D-glutamate ligase [Chlorobium sp.]
MTEQGVSGARVSVIGAGRSGVAAAILLAARGASVLLSELGSVAKGEIGRLHQCGVEVETGGHSERVLDVDFGVVSPGIPPSAPGVKALEQRGIQLYSEIEVASWFCRARIVGITGTDGKTTTATLVHDIVTAEGPLQGSRCWGVGNIGVPFSAMVGQMEEGDTAVVELSSYQLERCESFRPDVAVLTNITPDHLARYGGSMKRYADAKFRICMNQKEGDTLIYNADDPLLEEHFCGGAFPFRRVPFSLHEPPSAALMQSGAFLRDGEIVVARDGSERRVVRTDGFLKNSFRGRHNIYNALAAVAVSDALGIDDGVVRDALGAFEGVRHRQQFVRRLAGSDWINDSKATNVNAMHQALEAVGGKIVLIAGGRDKGNDYSAVLPLVADKVELLLAIGESSQLLADAFKGVVRVQQAASLEGAVSLARAAAGEGWTVLFSPGCASFDMFRDFEERGEQFMQCVNSLEE